MTCETNSKFEKGEKLKFDGELSTKTNDSVKVGSEKAKLTRL